MYLSYINAYFLYNAKQLIGQSFIITLSGELVVPKYHSEPRKLRFSSLFKVRDYTSMISFDSTKLMLRSSSMAQKEKKKKNEQTSLDGCIDVGIIANARDAVARRDICFA